jgi:hypothetical protein
MLEAVGGFVEQQVSAALPEAREGE